MGMTFWLKTEKGGAFTDRDLSFLCKTSTQLDQLCDALGVKQVSSFVDEAGAAAEAAEWFPELSIDSPDGPQWASSLDGIQTFHMLLETLLGNGEAVVPFVQERTRWFTADRLAELIDEVEYVLTALEEVGEGGFCLTLVG
jgi:hypothetical protein